VEHIPDFVTCVWIVKSSQLMLKLKVEVGKTTYATLKENLGRVPAACW